MNHLVLGATRSGKTLAQVTRIGPGTVVLDPHGSLSDLVARHRQGVVLDRLRRSDRGLCWRMLERGGALVEQEERVRAFGEIICRRRDITELRNTPVIEERLTDVLWLFMSTDLPLAELHRALNPNDPFFDFALSKCSNEQLKSRFLDLCAMTPYQRQMVAAPAERMLRNVLTSPAFALRCNGNFDFVSYLNQGGIIAV